MKRTLLVTVVACVLTWGYGLCEDEVIDKGGKAAFPLKASKDGRYLMDQAGKPFLINGDTPWSLTHNLTYDEAVRYMEDRRRKGFNALIISVPDAYGPDGSHLDPPDRQGNSPFLQRDITRPVEAYWAHVDRVLSKSEELGFLVLFFPAYLGCCEDGYLKLFLENGPARALEYGRWIGKRYRSRKNVIWVHGGDRDVKEAREIVAQIRSGIKEASPTSLHTVHWAPETDPWVPFGEDWIDIYTTYTYKSVPAQVLSHWNHHPTKPVVLIETHYENDFGKKTADDARKYPYRAILSGAAGHFFGNKPLWFCGRGWETALDSPGSRYMELVGRFFRSHAWHRLVPDLEHRLILDGAGDPGTEEGVQAAVSSAGNLAIAYVPSVRPLKVNLAVLSTGRVRESWWSPVSGKTVQTSLHERGATVVLTPPAPGDWLLVLESFPGSRSRLHAPRLVQRRFAARLLRHRSELCGSSP